MNWYTFAGTFLGGAIVIGGFIWQKTRNKVGTIAEVRAHLKIVPEGPPPSWTPAWTDGQDRPLKVGRFHPFSSTGPDESVKDVARRILEPIDRATGSDAMERGR